LCKEKFQFWARLAKKRPCCTLQSFLPPTQANTKKDFRFHHSRAFEFKENFACIQTIIYSMVRVATDHKHNANSFETEKIWPNTYSDEMKPKEKIMLEK
jgi:hypothetical protein